MKDIKRTLLSMIIVGVAGAMASAAGAHDVTVPLTGQGEMPPVQTAAKGEAKLSIQDDGTISGTVTTTDMKATMAHIHMAPAAGKNGPVIVKLEKEGEGSFKVPAGSKLTPEQMKAMHDGKLYVNVHSATHKDGEIRGQL